jgi:predicted Zn-dependent protease
MADMQARQQLQTPRGANQEQDGVQAMMSARARVLSQPGVDALRAWAQEANDASVAKQPTAKQMGILYGACMSWMQLRDIAQARALLPRLRLAAAKHAPSERLVQLLEAELAFKEDDMQGVLTSLRHVSAQANTVWQRPELIFITQASARLQVSSPNPETSQILAHGISALQRWVLQNAQDAQAWQVLATALAAQGRPLASLRAEGETQLARMDFGAAVDRFRAAQDASRKMNAAQADHIEASIVDARLRFAQGLLREQMLERQDR